MNDKNGVFKIFQIEDNIGESIHLHINNMRIDFTIKEFLDFSHLVRESMSGLDFLDGYSVENFDIHFLKEANQFLSNLSEIKIEEVRLSDLKCIVHLNYRSDLKLTKVVSIEKTPAFKFLQGDKDEFLKYNQYNYLNTNNEERLFANLKYIKKYGYPLNGEYIVLFNGQNYVRDGQHRAAILAYLNGSDAKIKVMRFYFNGKAHLVTQFKTNSKIVLKWFVRKMYRKLKDI